MIQMTLSEALIGVAAMLIAITAFLVGIRLVVRIMVLRNVGWDDGLVTLGWMFATAMNVMVWLLARNHGFGKHFWELSHEDKEANLKFNIICSTTWSSGMWATKTSFVVLYLRVLRHQGHGVVWLNRFLLVFLACMWIEEVCVVVFQCNPIERAWVPSLPGKCVPLEPVWYTGFSCNLVIDLILFIQPIPWMWRLQAPLIKRLGLVSMMSLGLLVVGISVLRITFVGKMKRMEEDFTYDLAAPMIWSQVEVCALIICSCMPSLRLIANRVGCRLSRVCSCSCSDSQSKNKNKSPRNKAGSGENERRQQQQRRVAADAAAVATSGILCMQEDDGAVPATYRISSAMVTVSYNQSTTTTTAKTGPMATTTTTAEGAAEEIRNEKCPTHPEHNERRDGKGILVVREVSSRSRSLSPPACCNHPNSNPRHGRKRDLEAGEGSSRDGERRGRSAAARATTGARRDGGGGRQGDDDGIPPWEKFVAPWEVENAREAPGKSLLRSPQLQ